MLVANRKRKFKTNLYALTMFGYTMYTRKNITGYYRVVDLSCIMVSTTLFKSVRSSSHEQSVPTCMNKPVNNHVQAGQLNHVQACLQPCSTVFKPVNRQKQAVRFYVFISAKKLACMRGSAFWGMRVNNLGVIRSVRGNGVPTNTLFSYELCYYNY